MRVKTAQHICRGLGVVVVAFAFASAAVLGCSKPIGPRVSLSPDSKVFVGRVAESVEPLTLDGCLPGEQYTGFLVSVENVFGDSALKEKRIALYPYALSSSCGSRPLRANELLSGFPPGARIRVVAEPRNPCHGTPLPSDAEVTRLFASVSDGDVVQVMPSDPDPSTSEPSDYSPEVGSSQQLRGGVVDFEIAKDLERLALAGTADEREAVAKRLMALPRFRGSACETLVNSNAHSEAESRRLIAMCRPIDPQVHR